MQYIIERESRREQNGVHVHGRETWEERRVRRMQESSLRWQKASSWHVSHYHTRQEHVFSLRTTSSWWQEEWLKISSLSSTLLMFWTSLLYMKWTTPEVLILPVPLWPHWSLGPLWRIPLDAYGGRGNSVSYAIKTRLQLPGVESKVEWCQAHCSPTALPVRKQRGVSMEKNSWSCYLTLHLTPAPCGGTLYIMHTQLVDAKNNRPIISCSGYGVHWHHLASTHWPEYFLWCHSCAHIMETQKAKRFSAV